jgi:hypothetical protein
MNTSALIASQQDLIDQGAEYLGDLIAWSICAETRLSEQALKQAAERVNLDTNYLPENPNKLSAFKNARTKAQTQLAIENLLIRQISNNGALVYGIVLENKSEKDKELRYTQLATYTFEKSNESTVWKRTALDIAYNGLIEMAKRTFDKWFVWSQEITGKEIRAMLTEFVKKSGVPFREKGGTYFVARNYRSQLTAFRELLPLIHRENYIRWMPIACLGDMDIIARQSLEKEVQAMSAYLDELLDPEKVSGTKNTTLQNQLKGYREVEDKTKMLSELLQFRSEALTNKLGKLRQRCLSELEQIATTPKPARILTIQKDMVAEPEQDNEDNLFDLDF